jgi:hypothetical protein
MDIKIKNVRIAFCQNLFKAGSMTAGDKPKFSATFLIAKDDPQLNVIRTAITRVASDKWADKAESILKGLHASGKICLRDGDVKSEYDGFEGTMFISTSSSTAPLVIDRDRTELAEADGRPYAGCYVNASINIWAQDNQYGKRVNAKLRGVQFVGDGDAFVGSAPAKADEFDDLSVTDSGGDDADEFL